MLTFNVPTNIGKIQAYTLLEILLTIMFVGILAAIIAPSFGQMYQKYIVNSSLEQLRTALQTAQKNAIKNSETCSITIDTNNNKITTTNDCLSEQRQLSKTIKIAQTNGNISFNFRGETNMGNTKVIVLADSNQSYKQCLLISDGIGLVRKGEYDGTMSAINSQNCLVSQ